MGKIAGQRMGLLDLFAGCVRRMRVAVTGYSRTGFAKGMAADIVIILYYRFPPTSSGRYFTGNVPCARVAS